MAQNDSTKMPPTTAMDFEPPVASKITAMTDISTVGISAVNVKMRRARFSSRVVGERSRKPRYSGRYPRSSPRQRSKKQKRN